MAVVTMYSPTGNPEVVNVNDVDEKLAQGYKTVEAWMEAQKPIQEQKYQKWMASEEGQKELMSMLTSARDGRLAQYDIAKNQLDRQIALADSTAKPALQALLAEWYAYAEALCALPDQEGSPWDGGGKLTPWPTQPKSPKAKAKNTTTATQSSYSIA